MHHAHEGEAAGQPGRLFHAMHIVVHKDGAQAFEHQNQAVGHQHLLQVITLVEKAEEGPFQKIAEHHGDKYAEQQHGDEMLAQIGSQRERHIGTDHVEAAMGEIDHAHDAEDQGQAGGQQKQQQSVLNRVQTLHEKCGDIHGNPSLSGISVFCPRGSYSPANRRFAFETRRLVADSTKGAAR